MERLTLKIEKMVHGGKGMARDNRNRPIFVPYALPNETVRVVLSPNKGRSTDATLEKIIDPSPDRVPTRCALAGVCAICDYQHIAYKAQLRFKQEIVQDQLERIGGVKKGKIRPIVAHPTPWGYQIETTLSPTQDGKLGYWSRTQRKVVPLEQCELLHPRLQTAITQIELELPTLRKLTLRLGKGEELLLVLQTEDAEPPELELDFPASVALVFPDGVSATLLGDLYLMQTVCGRDWRVSGGTYFPNSWAGAEMVANTIVRYADLKGGEVILDGFAGMGLMAGLLATKAKEVIGVEKNPDAVEDMAFNLHETENVRVYNDWLENVLAMIPISADLVLLDSGEEGVSEEAWQGILRLAPPRIIYSNPNLTTMSRDTALLLQSDYQLIEVQPIDMQPNSHQIHTVALWQHR